ncbi:Cytochrome P450 monooxygenase ALT8 [Paramyrothecium foliicola]|nr:Cytochrome P450 monooxygenase ALT8 [Paramyrothecium foliicola]
MVFPGRFSSGCFRCRKRKVKCDEAKPSCQRCAVYGQPCPGYTDQFHFRYRNNSSKGYSGDLACSSSPDRPKPPAQEPMQDENNSDSIVVKATRTTVPLQIDQRQDEVSLSYFVNRFVSPVAIDGFPGHLNFIPALFDHTHHGLLETATLCVAQMAAYNQSKDNRFRVTSYQNYGKTIRGLQKAITQDEEAKADRILATVLLLCIFKDMSGESFGDASEHAAGIYYLLDIRGIEQLATSTGVELLIFSLMRLHVYAFLHNDDRYNDVSGATTLLGQFDPLVHGMAIMSHILRLRGTILADLAAKKKGGSLEDDGIETIADKRTELIFQEWLEALQELDSWHAEAPKYWERNFQDRTAPPALGQVATEGRYYDPETACTTILLRSARLVLLSSMFNYFGQVHTIGGVDEFLGALSDDIRLTIDDMLGCVPYAMNDAKDGKQLESLPHDGAAALVILHSVREMSRSGFATPTQMRTAQNVLGRIYETIGLQPTSPHDVVTNRTLFETKRSPGDLFFDVVNAYPGAELIYLSPLQRQLLVTNPRLLADILVHNPYDFVKPGRISSFLRHVLGDGLIIVEGDKHKFLRKNTMPAFSFRHIKDLYPMMWAKAEILSATLKREELGSSKGGAVVELTNWASKVTLDIIGIAGLGRELNTLEKSTDPLSNIYEELLEPSSEKLAFAMTAFIFGVSTVKLFPWRMNGIFNHLTTSLSSICRIMIQEKRDAILKNKDDHFDILSLLIKSNNFPDEELKDQLLTFLAAGHETTSSALTWACYLLAKHPGLQEKLRQEVRDALPADEAVGAMADLATTLEQMPYLNGIMNETLRLYPTVPLTIREAIRDTNLGGQPIPKGTSIVLSMWLINRSPELWGSDAAEFRPERWITEAGKPNQNGGAASNYHFLTFLHGPRSCIGQGFARAEMRCLLAALVRSFSWDLAMDERDILPRGVITIKPANGMYLRLKPLDLEKIDESHSLITSLSAQYSASLNSLSSAIQSAIMKYGILGAILAHTAVLAEAGPAKLGKRLDNGLGLTPHMGASSWNVAQCDSATEKYALDTAEKFVSLGLRELGYTYVNIDDCWAMKTRDSSGNLVPDAEKWPNGIKPVADKLHSMGLKLGLYGCAGTLTCARYPGSWGHELQDAKRLAEWDIDFWKHDACEIPCPSDISPNCHTRPIYEKMRDALASVRDIKNINYNLCQWGQNNVWTWGSSVANSWRMSGDNWQNWQDTQRIASEAARIAQYAGPGGFNDLDMLILGNKRLTETQERTHFGIWAIAKSPLGVIDINQDKLGKAAAPFQPPGAPEPVFGKIYPYWAGPLSDGVVIGLVADDGGANLTVNFKDVPGLGNETYSWKEMYSGQTGSGTNVTFNLAEHDMAVIRVNTTQPTTSELPNSSSIDSHECEAEMYSQCGGKDWNGCTRCVSGTSCTSTSEWYAQCVQDHIELI